LSTAALGRSDAPDNYAQTAPQPKNHWFIRQIIKIDFSKIANLLILLYLITPYFPETPAYMVLKPGEQACFPHFPQSYPQPRRVLTDHASGS